MSYCKNCGKENADTAKFCTGCGDSLSILIHKNAANQSVNYKKRITLIITSLIVVSAAIYFLFIQNSSKGIEKGKSASEEILNSNQNIQPFVAKSSYDIPPELDYSPSLKTSVKTGYYGPSFFPVGFSKDGKFAWAEGENPGESNDYSFTIYIQDLSTDKILWQWSAEAGFDDNETDQMVFNEKSFKNIWVKQNKFLTSHLNDYQIEPLKFEHLEQFPVRHNGKIITLSLHNKMFEGNEGFSEIASTRILVLADGEKKKVIFNKNYEKTGTDEYIGFETLVNRYILGYLKNPLENRIVVFLFDDYIGWEAGHYPKIQMIGCDLNTIY